MSDKGIFLQYLRLTTLLKERGKSSKRQEKIEKKIRRVMHNLDSIRREDMSRLFDRQLKVLEDRGFSKEAILAFYRMKERVIDQLIKIKIDDNSDSIPFILAIRQDTPPGLMFYVSSIAKSFKSYIRNPRLIGNCEEAFFPGPYVILDIQFDKNPWMYSWADIRKMIHSLGRGCLSLTEFDYLYLQYPEIKGNIYCAGSYFDTIDNIIDVCCSDEGVVLGVVSDKYYHTGLMISCGCRLS